MKWIFWICVIVAGLGLFNEIVPLMYAGAAGGALWAVCFQIRSLMGKDISDWDVTFDDFFGASKQEEKPLTDDQIKGMIALIYDPIEKSTKELMEDIADGKKIFDHLGVSPHDADGNLKSREQFIKELKLEGEKRRRHES